MKNHWTKKLQDGRHFFRHEASQQELLFLSIKEMELKLKRLKKEYQINEESILTTCAKHWTQEEIANALNKK
ncbi:hypothetical protein [Runella sp.]|uniref:hypothetical protein n=1 Tax=Runella sp. TaxID=1960881 RepID=UPI003D13F801